MPILPESFLTAPITHRARHDGNVTIAENNLRAIDQAIAEGFGIELDLQLSRCGTAMVFHDYSLDRLTNTTGPITQQDRAALADIEFKTGETGIPSFAEVLAHVDGRVPLLIELKDQDGAMGPNIGALEASAAQAVRGYGGDIAFMSFNPHSVVRMAELCPDLPRGITACGYPEKDWHLLPADTRAHLAQLPDYERAQASFISHQWTDLNNPRVAELKENGAHVLCWTVRSAADEIEARKVADNVTFELYTPSMSDPA